MNKVRVWFVALSLGFNAMWMIYVGWHIHTCFGLYVKWHCSGIESKIGYKKWKFLFKEFPFTIFTTQRGVDSDLRLHADMDEEEVLYYSTIVDGLTDPLRAKRKIGIEAKNFRLTWVSSPSGTCSNVAVRYNSLPLKFDVLGNGDMVARRRSKAASNQHPGDMKSPAVLTLLR